MVFFAVAIIHTSKRRLIACFVKHLYCQQHLHLNFVAIFTSPVKNPFAVYQYTTHCLPIYFTGQVVAFNRYTWHFFQHVFHHCVRLRFKFSVLNSSVSLLISTGGLLQLQ